MAQQAAYAGTGRRKDSVARVRLVPGNGQITINKVPAAIRTQPIIDLGVNFSCRKTNASISVITTLSLSIGTTLDASPSCRAL